MLFLSRSRAACVLLSVALLTACGGGGGGSPAPTPTPSPTPTPTPTPTPVDTSLYDPAGPSASFAQQCAASNTLAPADKRTASLTTEKKWLRAYFDEAYLWRDQVSRVDPTLARYSGSDAYVAMDAYFEALKSTQVTDTGAPRDRFSFTYPTELWKTLTESGVEAGYGIEWHMASTTPPRRIRIAYVESGSPADRAGLARGDELTSIDGVSSDVNTQAGLDALNAGLYPAATGTTHAFVFKRGSTSLTPSLTSAEITRTPVPLSRVLTLSDGRRAGYLLFNEHLVPAERQLMSAVSDFRTQGIQELVLDLRYNGGGYLYIASELATMIAGTTRTTGQTFETLKYNARRSSENETTPFYSQSCVYLNGGCTDVKPLPTLNLARVYVLAQSGTCSASESIINSLRGINVEVVLIGGKTCGKPYGFTAKDNCGISYFPIEFSGVNAKGFGDYADGFEPGTGASQRFVPGCAVADDFDQPLGHPQEGMLAAALGHAVNGQCPPRAAGSATVRAQAAVDGVPLLLQRHPARSNRLLRPAASR